MGLFGRLSSKKKNKYQYEYKYENEQEIPVRENYNLDGKRPSRANTKTERLALIKDNCEQITEGLRQIDEAKIEYQAVTSYLTDMQKIDLIPKEQREVMEDAARRIMNLTKERERFREKNTTISDTEYRLFERYELQIPKELETIRVSEEYQTVIQKDLEQLEREKQRLMEEEEEIINKHFFLKGIAITICVIVLLLFLIFAGISKVTGANLTLPFLLTVLMGMASAMYIFMEARKNQYDIKLVELKTNRAVMLLNKVKIKSVNNRNYLEYSLSKYMVDNYSQLKSRWEEYVKLKDEARRYQSNTELLEFYNNELIHELKKFGIADSEIWIYQPNAIIDNREMVEVRHRLNVRRQKLRERIDINNKQKEEAVNSITAIVKEYPDCEQEAVQILKRYKIKQ